MELLVDKLKTTLDGLGSTERTKPMNSNNPNDAILHEFRVAQYLRTYGEKRYEKAKKALKKTLSERLTDAIQDAMSKVIKLSNPKTVALLDAEHHHLSALVNPGASYLDSEGLKLALKLKYMDDQDEIEKLFVKHTKRYSPTTTYIVANKLEDIEKHDDAA